MDCGQGIFFSVHLQLQKKSPFSQSNSDFCHLTTRPFIPKLENIFPNSREKAPFLQYLENALVVNGNYFFLTLGQQLSGWGRQSAIIFNVFTCQILDNLAKHDTQMKLYNISFKQILLF